MRLALAVGVLLVAGCATVPANRSPAGVPTASDPSAHPVTPTQSAAATPTPTTAANPRAELTIIARGDYRSRDECYRLILDYGGCQPRMFIDPLGMTHAAAWTPYDPAISFDDRFVPWIYAAQSKLPPGNYGVALALELFTDVPTCATIPSGHSDCRSGEVICVGSFDVTDQTERVIVTADYSDPCSLEITTVPQ